jgi:hypothetical protein
VKNLNFLCRPGIPRDEKGWAAFTSVEQLRGIFTDAEICVMANHYLVTRDQWQPEYLEWKKRRDERNRENNRKQEEAAAARRAAKPQLKPGIPLREQLQRKQ